MEEDFVKHSSMIGDLCIDIIRDSVRLGEEKELRVKQEIDQAYRENRFVFVMYENKAIGFLTWHVKPEGIFFNNCCVMREFRRKDSLIGLRKYFKGKRLFWRNRRRQKERSWNT
jgi:hypothetical protein